MAREFQKANHFNFNYGDPPNYHVFGYLNKHKHFMTFDFRWNDEAVRAEFVNFVLRKYNVVVINSNLLCQFVLYCIVCFSLNHTSSHSAFTITTVHLLLFTPTLLRKLRITSRITFVGEGKLLFSSNGTEKIIF